MTSRNCFVPHSNANCWSGCSSTTTSEYARPRSFACLNAARPISRSVMMIVALLYVCARLIGLDCSVHSEADADDDDIIPGVCGMFAITMYRTWCASLERIPALLFGNLPMNLCSSMSIATSLM
jgi:hypothetical protein